MSLKHYIITRFLSDNFNHTNEELFSKEWLENAFSLTEKHFIRTLENQTNKNFEIIFVIHNEIDYKRVSKLENLSNVFQIHVLRKNKLENFFTKVDCDTLITSRLDYDDNIHKSVVNDIQNYVQENPNKIIIYGLNTGATVVDGEVNTFLREKSGYEINETGYWSAMETLVLPKELILKPFSIYALGNHSAVVREMKENFQKYGITSLNSDFFHKDTSDEVKYLWVRHKQSQSVLERNIWHTTNQEVFLNLKENFGYEI